MIEVIEVKEQQRETVGEEGLNNLQTGEKRAVNNPALNDEAEFEFTPLFESRVAEQFRAHWLKIQSRFVDDPLTSVKAADDLVITVIENIVSTIAENRMTLEDQWSRADQASTEELRRTLKRYRSFFNRLLSVGS